MAVRYPLDSFFIQLNLYSDSAYKWPSFKRTIDGKLFKNE